MQTITIASLNIAAASKERARRLLDGWLTTSSHDVYILSETSDGQGTTVLSSAFRAAGWQVFQRPTLPKDRGVLVATRIRASESTDYPSTDPAPGRSVIIALDTVPRVAVVGMYVPNRGNDPAKLARKQAFLSCWLKYFVDSECSTVKPILVGDLNVVPPPQKPVFLPQYQFEYDWYASLNRLGRLSDVALRNQNRHESTWIAHTGEGYTYDHILLHEALLLRVVSFKYDHSTRVSNLSDHSALILTIALDTVDHLHQNPLRQAKQTELF